MVQLEEVAEAGTARRSSALAVAIEVSLAEVSTMVQTGLELLAMPRPEF